MLAAALDSRTKMQVGMLGSLHARIWNLLAQEITKMSEERSKVQEEVEVPVVANIEAEVANIWSALLGDHIEFIAFVIAHTIYNTHTVHTLHLIARTYHVMFTSIHLRFPHFTCDHVSQQLMITPDNVAYYAQLFTLVT